MTQKDNYRTTKPLEARIALHRRFADPEKDTFLAAWRMYPFQRGMRVLEVGCGTGAFWKHVAGEDVVGELDLVLTDTSEAMLEKTRALLGDRPEIRAAEASDLPFDDGSFDAVVSNFVLPFVADRDAAAREMARVLRPEGFAGVSMPARAHMRDMFDAGGLAFDMPFHAEDAPAVLEPHFGTVDAQQLVDTMEITEAEPAVAWLGSLPSAEPAHLEHLRTAVEAAIRERGHFPVRRATGLYVGRRPTRST